MAEAFLCELLQVQNRVRPDEDQKCIICMEECGTMNPVTGLSENAIRLPFCGHIVGSGCIVQWLRTNNTCPMCRHVFFPAQSRPHLEHGNIESQSDHVLTSQARTVRGQILNGSLGGITDFLREMKRLCDIYCDQLSLQPGTGQIALYVFSNLLNPGSANATTLEDVSDKSIIAVSIYIASHLTGHPRSPRDISRLMGGVDSHDIRVNYDLLVDRRAIIDDGIRYELDEVFNIRTITWPPHRN